MDKEEEMLKEKARGILAKYSVALPERWKGYKLVWHAWHKPSKLYPLTYQSYLRRIVQIEMDKPEKERAIRFRYMRPTKGKFAETASYTAGVSAWQKSDVAWKKYYAAWKKWNESGREEIDRLWHIECPVCPWDDKNKCMVFN